MRRHTVRGHEILEPTVEYRHPRGTFRIPLMAWLAIFVDDQEFAREAGSRYPRTHKASIDRVHDAQVFRYAQEHNLLDDA